MDIGYNNINNMNKFDTDNYKKALYDLRRDLKVFINEENNNPILLRFAWHDAGTYDKDTKKGGANGSIRFDGELNHGANAGLIKARGQLQKFKDKYPILSFADIIHMASAVGIELAGGPVIKMRYGRIDADKPATEGNLPDALPPFAGGRDKSPEDHLTAIFHRMGFNDREIVALSGAHTLGRNFNERSGTTANGYTKPTRYTTKNSIARYDNKNGIGMQGGRSWTKQWLTFDNSYFTHARDNRRGSDDSKDELTWLPTDAVLATHPKYSKYFELYARSQDAFFVDFAESYRRLSELGSEWVVPGGIMIEDTDIPKSRL